MPSSILSSILLYHIPDENWAMYASKLDILHNGLCASSGSYPCRASICPLQSVIYTAYLIITIP